MNVLSLFDGMSCTQIALKNLGIKVDKYYASEIDKYAIQITQKNFPDTVQLGDVKDIKGKDLPEIDLIVAGSPCQGFSFAGKQLAFDDPRSALFFEFVRILREVKPKYFLLENVRMKKEFQAVISEQVSNIYPEYTSGGLFNIEPILINSALVSAQNRNRLYWTNIPGIEQPDDLGIVLRDVLEDSFVADRNKSYCIDANYYKGGNPKNYFKKSRRQLVFNTPKQVGVAKEINGHDILKRVYSEDGKSPTLNSMGGGNREPKVVVSKIRDKSKTVRSGGRLSYNRHEWDSVDELHWRKLTPLECERLQTVPDNYTEGVSNTQRYKMLGNGFTVRVIEHILKNI